MSGPELLAILPESYQSPARCRRTRRNAYDKDVPSDVALGVRRAGVEVEADEDVVPSDGADRARVEVVVAVDFGLDEDLDLAAAVSLGELRAELDGHLWTSHR